MRALILVDELDVLVSKPTVLAELFSLPLLADARCVLVGAANTMNLTENLLPRGLSSFETTLVSFPAYTVLQLGKVLRARLKTLPWPVFDEMALDLCARKVAAASGDCRCALMAACGALKGAQAEAEQAAEEGSLAPSQVRMSHMAEALSHIFKSPVVDTIKGLPSDQKLVLCALLLLMRSSGQQEVAQGQVSDKYMDLCRKQSVTGRVTIAPLQFSSACTALAGYSLISCENASRRVLERERRVSLTASEEDVVFALQDSQFMARMIAEAAL